MFNKNALIETAGLIKQLEEATVANNLYLALCECWPSPFPSASSISYAKDSGLTVFIDAKHLDEKEIDHALNKLTLVDIFSVPDYRRFVSLNDGLDHAVTCIQFTAPSPDWNGDAYENAKQFFDGLQNNDCCYKQMTVDFYSPTDGFLDDEDEQEISLLFVYSRCGDAKITWRLRINTIVCHALKKHF
ncbi:hypothetical protein ACTFQF_04330 [Aliivibrio fischeri]|uniref:hypothetical protein n=1 Tax=Aliivibrio fischeri TaxID=668 RepID=UPI0007C58F90|nr:hypothetical protein [Aliivibrio fischeri]MBP3140472.1 hypothetical protein [Aliivibrio fischeri]MBP3156210.1 hypothetical protein [Aliivibrio fischeri]